jgi:tRNA G18 (ribose-2'-O)-methylase SpoU
LAARPDARVGAGTRSAPIEISDPADPRLDDFRDLSRADRRPDRPGGRGLVIAEGVIVVRRLIDSAYPVRALLGIRRRYEELADDLASDAPPFFVTTAEVMAEVVGFHLNRGVLATADRVDFPPAAELARRARSVAVLEGVGDHENLGAVFRNAAALGVDAVLLAPGCADPLYRRSVRVSMGTVLQVPFAPLPWLDEGVSLLRLAGFRIVALTPGGELTLREYASRESAPGGSALVDSGLRAAPRDSALSEPAPGTRMAIMVGSEGPGLTRDALRAADVRVRIPMTGGVDSLNVATAAAIAFAALCG